MPRLYAALSTVAAGFCLWLAHNSQAEPPKAAPPAKIDFNRQILPILSDHCFACHGPDEKKRKADLRLDTKEGAFAKRDDGDQLIVPGKASESVLIERINSDERDKLMPPPKHNKPLSASQKQLLQDWINQGANWNTHWAFVAPVRPNLPATKNATWVKNSIDAFILARLEQENLQPSAPANKAMLLRRVTFDLTGLPPTFAELDAFLADNLPNAYEKVVDRLLGSPRFGEHQARYWLDVARYGDTHGLHLDNYREIWPYREWVINAFNRNLPYHQFITEQLAGDLLPNHTLDQVIATGYNRCHVTTNEGGSIEEEVYVRNVVDQVDTFGTVFLGLSTGCARCHDHKYDPLTTKDYYQLFAFLNNIDGSPMDGNSDKYAPITKVGSPEQLASLDRLQKQIDQTRQKLNETLAKIEYSDPTPTVKSELKRQDFVWIDDEIPPGSTASGDGSHNGQWQFVSAPNAHVFSGRFAHTHSGKGLTQHFVENAKPGLIVGQGDILFAYVYLDPKNPPKEIMLQWNTNGWKHRAYWGENAISWGTDKTGERMQMGSLPEAGRWVRLNVPINKVGLKPGDTITGWAFTQFDGKVFWDRVGVTTSTPQGTVTFSSLAAWLLYEQAVAGANLPKSLQNSIKLAPGKRNDDQNKQLRNYFLENIHPTIREQFTPFKKELDKFNKEKQTLDQQIPVTMVSKERKEQRAAYILKRGEYDKRGDQVTRNTPAMFPPLGDRPKDRLGLTQWLLASEHPLTARVAVNRFWQQLFGTGLVKTTEDLGTQGEPPSHPELLDWLAVEFRESGWNIKKLFKLMVMSATYQQTSKITPDRLAKDPNNRLYSRGPRFRLDAEMVRDQALFVSGLLVEKIGGPSVKPPQPSGLWEAVGYVTSNTANFTADTGHEKVHRRSLYTFWKRTAPPPQMSAFDAPSRESCTARRERTNTPLQALLLLNETQYIECARSLAQRSMLEGGSTLDAHLQFLFKTVLLRPATAGELEVLKAAYEEHHANFSKNKAEGEKLLAVGESKPGVNLPVPDVAALTLVANIVLNLDETVTKE